MSPTPFLTLARCSKFVTRTIGGMKRGTGEKSQLAMSGRYAHAYPYAPSAYSAGGTAGYLPKLPGVRMRPPSSLKPMVTAAPNMGPHPHVFTVPREKSHRLSSSDSKALEALRASSKSSMHSRRNIADEKLLQKPQSPAGHPPFVPVSQRPPSSVQPLSRTVYSTLPPIAAPTQENREESDCSNSESSHSETESGESEEDEIISEEGSEAPPSKPGFESAEQSAQNFSVPFPEVANPCSPFPAILIQDHAQLDMERFAACAHPSGLSPRVDNIVKAFRIHGPLDRDLLSKALDEVASLHPLLTATFQRCKDRLYIQTSQGNVSVNLETPIIGHEQPQDLIINARRKLFALSMRNDLSATESSEKMSDSLSLVSLVSTECPPESTVKVLNPKRKSVTFGKPQVINSLNPSRNVAPLPALHNPTQLPDTLPSLLMRARLVPKNPHEHILVLSFPRIVCDFWSSCLFMQQLADAYSKLEKSLGNRASLAAVRIESKRQAVVQAYGRSRGSRVHQMGSQRGRLQSRDAARLLQRRPLTAKHFKPAIPAQVHFQQVAQRENQLLKMMPKEKLWAFWESMITATIRRQRGPNRVKVVPPVRVPSGLGEKLRGRPQTSRLRPLTAARNRPTTARRVLGEMGVTREVLSGPPTLFHFIKVEEAVCNTFKMSLPEEYLACISEEEVLSLMCLGAYVLLLGKCCRGWGADERKKREEESGYQSHTHRERFLACPGILKATKGYISDPLQQYRTDSRLPPTIVVPGSPLRRARRAAMGGRLDLGSFLIGVEVSLRDSTPQMTAGLFGPLTNDVGIRVNLSSCESFADLVVALGRSLQLARQHGHFPFHTVAEELGLIRGLPIKFSFLHRRDIVQLTNPDKFYFSETAVGVEGHGLARFGSNCYLTPLSTKMDDSCYFELLLWEGYEGESVGGGFRYQSRVIRTELVEAFGEELCSLLSAVAKDPTRPLLELASQICPPFFSNTRMRSRKF